MSRVGNPGPLEGVRVLDVARQRAGPAAGLMMSRMGADVIKVEPPEGEYSRKSGPTARGQSVYWPQYNSGKRSLGVDLYSEKGKEILRRLVAVSDIFIQNFRPGTIEAMGFGYPVLKSLNPRIVMVNISAYGQYGPYWERPGMDRVASALSGFMYSHGAEGMPPIMVGESVLDQITALHATIGALGALWERQQSGEGQSLDLALADSGYVAMAIPMSYYKATGKVRPRPGLGSGLSGAFNCKDGMVFAMLGGANMLERISKTIGHPEWAEQGRRGSQRDPAAASQEEKEFVAVAGKELERWFSQRTVAEVVSIISELGAIIAPINTVAQAAEDPHPWARDVMVEVPDPVAGKIHVPGDIMHYSRSGYNIGPGPTPGQHTQEILTEILGMTDEDVRQLKEAKVI
ncbi:MAG: CoA transferase [Dehalococcoidia bacterium]|nr:CoA transferase [Dehalococcoidia bacterium]